MLLPEDFLHYIWKFKLFVPEKLITDKKESITVISPGMHNRDAGPDFQNAKLKIGNQIWAGNVEIHKKASDWKKHGHHTDPAYNNVILHLVADKDDETIAENSQTIPIAVLSFKPKLFDNYRRYIESKQRPLCKNDLPALPKFTLNSWLDALTAERLEQKTEALKHLLSYTGNNREEAFYIHLASAFGGKVNAPAFELTAKSLPSIILAKHKNNLFQLEALLLGQAGILLPSESDDDYIEKLKNEYRFLQKKFNLTPIEGHLWKYLRIRPANFPEIRLAQFARLVWKSVHLFSKVLEAKNTKELEHMFDISLSDYWDTHYKIGKESPKRKKTFGHSARQSVIINTVIPALFLYGQDKGLPKYRDRAADFLEQLPPENNRTIRQWEDAGIKVANAAQSQALLQLHKAYCSPKRCLDCRIGNQLIINA